MPPRAQRSSRRQQILEALASELESNPGTRITTAHLAHVVGVSEAALYRHFPSKAKMFEGLIEFAEDTVFQRVNRILAEEKSAPRRCEQIVALLLGFAERNPGITRVLLGDPLVGESERLRSRAAQFFGRLETQLKQIFRETEPLGATRKGTPSGAAANLLMAVVEGRMAQFSRSDFQRSPVEGWATQWSLLETSLFSAHAVEPQS
ncbi:MAG: nucleoid occlusion factor SlmA [Gammaproteobacteria bacterium]|nr:nucleoid occlusion factor SlmA [Gammaproteobacteria bacterium]NIR82724.1 nucleoid occlusion factor SlmA [Gammaproteobacteria bacterium]NIR89588.1 nucleoid occlusion factor SlmA [Gammaproteobacteria bacterium]NIU03884.1 nucleoid occlusion factor SlmA [Gammaproteobacteria bacterium]NIV51200.1 nucleoid occlusion factor SlmA [Gammaproteobacteria bacterium]